MQYCRGGKKTKRVSPGNDFMEQIFTGELSGVDSTRVLRQGVINISDGDDEVKFIKKTSLHPRDKLKRLSNYLIRNQTDKKNYPQILPQKKLIRKNKIKVKILNILKKFHYIDMNV